jgi:hypothetical protein
VLGVIDGCRSGIRVINRPIAPRDDLDGTTVGGVRAGRTAHEGKPAFCGWKSARTARQGRCGRLRFTIRPCVHLLLCQSGGDGRRRGGHGGISQERLVDDVGEPSFKDADQLGVVLTAVPDAGGEVVVPARANAPE